MRMEATEVVDFLYRDDDLLVINKPPGLLSQPDHTGDVDVLALCRKELAENENDEPFLGLVHRLDRPASGVMVLARTSEAARILSKQFRERVIEKRYLVLVEGKLAGIGSWVDYIAKSGRQPRIVPAANSDGKRAELQWQVLVSMEEKSLVQVELTTGRPHQIRLQASSRGHPVIGDRRYGADVDVGDRSLALHQALLRFEPPSRSARETFVARPPSIWSEVTTPAMDDAIDRFLRHT